MSRGIPGLITSASWYCGQKVFSESGALAKPLDAVIVLFTMRLEKSIEVCSANQPTWSCQIADYHLKYSRMDSEQGSPQWVVEGTPHR